MNFNSLEFSLFLPIVLLLYHSVYRRERIRDVLLLAASYLFYMSWYWEYAGLIALSTLVDYFIGRQMSVSSNQHNRRLLLTTSLTTNLGLLAYFKYNNFFIELGQEISSPWGWDLSFLHHDFLLPVGISFYTFQTLSYTIDIYRKKLDPEPSLTKFAVFVSFFPQLVAGPIVRAADFLPQINSRLNLSKEQFNFGMRLIFCGLFKKIVIADLLAFMAVDAVFANPDQYSSLDLLLALYGYAFQIYCDFSGYSDIAIGVAALMGFKLPVNFNRPYLSQNIREFWTRWHISLSSWLKDYLYISLGGNRGTQASTIRNLMVTMLLGGLWHGAALNFVLWGGYQGLLLVFSRQSERHTDSKLNNYHIWINRFVCFHLVCFGWLLFRVTDWENFTEYLYGLGEFSTGSQLHWAFYGLLIFAAFMHLFPQEKLNYLYKKYFEDRSILIQGGSYAILILLLTSLSIGSPTFIYFQF